MKKRIWISAIPVLLLFSCTEPLAIFEQSSISGYDSFSEVVATMDSKRKTATLSFGESFSSQPAKVIRYEEREENRTTKDDVGVSHTYTNRHIYFKVDLSEEDGKSLFPLMEEKIPSMVELRSIYGILLCECSKYYDGKIRSSATVAKPIEY
ncbi:MAG: hypothetical protein J5736_03280, partial [Bacilli bacterium]|nr:hypothetical protein [Bacilli bacterium]